MRELDIEKVTINISTTTDIKDVERAAKFLEEFTNQKPAIVKGKKRVQQWGVRPGIPKGAMVTLRKEKAKEYLNKLLEAIDRTLDLKNFDEFGNFSFGIKENLLIPGVKYKPEIGILGMDVCVSLKRKGGWRNKYRKIKKSKIPLKHRIKKEEAIEWVKNNFNVKIEKKQKIEWI